MALLFGKSLYDVTGKVGDLVKGAGDRAAIVGLEAIAARVKDAAKE